MCAYKTNFTPIWNTRADGSIFSQTIPWRWLRRGMLLVRSWVPYGQLVWNGRCTFQQNWRLPTTESRSHLHLQKMQKNVWMTCLMLRHDPESWLDRTLIVFGLHPCSLAWIRAGRSAITPKQNHMPYPPTQNDSENLKALTLYRMVWPYGNIHFVFISLPVSL